jgi:hypothetical protein
MVYYSLSSVNSSQRFKGTTVIQNVGNYHHSEFPELFDTYRSQKTVHPGT